MRAASTGTNRGDADWEHRLGRDYPLKSAEKLQVRELAGLGREDSQLQGLSF
jgi:hypothetical protein